MKNMEPYRKKLEQNLFSSSEESPTVITAMTLKIHSFNWDEKVEVKRYPGDVFLQIHPSRTARNVPKTRRLQTRELRSAFEQVDTADELGQFLSVCGPFRDPSRRRVPSGVTQQLIDWHEFEAWQRFMRALQEKRVPCEEIESSVPEALTKYVLDFQGIRLASIQRDAPEPHFEAVANTALEVIAATIAADLLDRVPLRKCGDCERLYVKRSLHDDRKTGFCGDACRHRHWQRTNRPSKRSSGEKTHGKA